MKKSADDKLNIFKTLLMPVLVLGIVIFFFTSLSNLDASRSSEGRAQLERSIRRACVSCYALEGFYPPTVDYVCDRYGIIIDADKYNVFYDAFSANLMPDITVIEINE